MKCKYCNNSICGSNKKMIVAEWNECPWHRADWETNTSVIYWLLDIITLGLAKVWIFEYKLKKYSEQLLK